MGALEEVNKRTHWLEKPKYPGFVTQLQYIKNFWVNPCNAPFVVYVETALPAFGLALLEWFDFGVMDVWRGFYRPKGLARPARAGHGSRRGRARKGFGGVPDLGDELGKLLRPDDFHARQVSDGVRHMWVIYTVIERFLWYWMLIDIVTHFLFNWASALNRTEFCSKAEVPRALFLKDEVVILGNNTVESWFWDHELYNEHNCLPFPGGAAGWRSGFQRTMIVSGQIEAWDPNNPPIGAKLGVVYIDGGSFVWGDSSNGTYRGAVGDFVSKYTTGGVAPIIAAATKTGGGAAKITNCYLTVFYDPI